MHIRSGSLPPSMSALEANAVSTLASWKLESSRPRIRVTRAIPEAWIVDRPTRPPTPTPATPQLPWILMASYVGPAGAAGPADAHARPAAARAGGPARPASAQIETPPSLAKQKRSGRRPADRARAGQHGPTSGGREK